MDKRLVVITGHYGSGKTEFAVNYAILCSKIYKKVNLADLDIVNPYFRSRDKAEILNNFGIKVTGSMTGDSTLEVPALPAEIRGLIDDQEAKTIIDAGGDPVGARVLARYAKYIEKHDFDMFMVINANRPDTQSVDSILKYIQEIEFSSKLKITGLINNTHLLKKTTKDEVYKGHELVNKVFEHTGLPIRYESAIKSVADEINSIDKNIEVFPFDLYMRESWMS
jgi:hypothetical protein